MNILAVKNSSRKSKLELSNYKSAKVDTLVSSSPERITPTTTFEHPPNPVTQANQVNRVQPGQPGQPWQPWQTATYQAKFPRIIRSNPAKCRSPTRCTNYYSLLEPPEALSISATPLAQAAIPHSLQLHETAIADSRASGTYLTPQAPITDANHTGPTITVGTASGHHN